MKGLLACALLMCSGAAASARIVDATTGFAQTNWAFGQSNTTGMAWAPDGSGRLFITVKGSGNANGAVRIIQLQPGGTGMLLATPFATVNPVYTNSECGVIGIAFDPDFIANGYVYLFVTVSASEQQIIRYTAVGNVGMNKTTIVPGLPTAGQNHDGGALGVGWDNKLYWAIGDNGNGSGVNANLTSLAAKVGRANLDGTLPGDNPFADGPGGNNDYIWARGFRNPFTLTFQPSSGELWVDVVGTGWEQAFVVRRGDHAGYNAYENNQPAGFITPVIAYVTGQNRTLTITNAARSAGVTTFTMQQNHYLRRGERITVSGVGNASFNGTVYVDSAPRAGTTFTVLQPGQPDATPGAGGSVTTFTYGRSLTGATFYDGALFPAAYRGNYFFTDFVDGLLMRAQVGPGVQVNQVDLWADMLQSPVDAAVGPDGALYVAQIGGQILRMGYTPAAQAIVVAEQNLRANEGREVATTVRLARMPAAPVTVTVARASGDADVTVAAGATLTFSTTSWMDPQVVRFAGAEDSDASDDSALFTVASGGLTDVPVNLRVTDNDASTLAVSTPTLMLTEGMSATFTVVLTAQPAASVDVTVARSTGDPDVAVSAGAALTFTAANWNTPQTVTVAAAQDADNTDDAAVITASAAGFAARSVAVSVRDDELRAPMITSSALTAAVVGSPYRYDVDANGNPAPTYALVAPTPVGMTIDAGTGVITWTPAAAGSFPVVVRASNGVTPDATQAFTVVVRADAAPTASLTRPREGDVVSGTTAEFYGDGLDDAGAVRAEFYVDGVLGSTDPGSMGHFHFNGAHLLWDTTRYPDGPHRLRFVVFDAGGQSGMQEVSVTIANAGPGDGDGGGGDGALGGDGGEGAGGGDDGCGCRAGGRARGGAGLALALALLAAALLRGAPRRGRRD